jgi:hypothetical protein
MLVKGTVAEIHIVLLADAGGNGWKKGVGRGDEDDSLVLAVLYTCISPARIPMPLQTPSPSPSFLLQGRTHAVEDQRAFPLAVDSGISLRVVHFARSLPFFLVLELSASRLGPF